MILKNDPGSGLAGLLRSHDGVPRVESVMTYLSRDALRWRITSGRWQQPCRGIVVAQSGPLTELQVLRIAGVQQRLVRVGDLAAIVARNQRLPRRALITGTLDDIAGGAQALSELDFTRLPRRHRLPEPDRQAERRDSAGRRRWPDAVWEAATWRARSAARCGRTRAASRSTPDQDWVSWPGHV